MYCKTIIPGLCSSVTGFCTAEVKEGIKWFLQVINVSSKPELMLPSSFRIEVGNALELLLLLCIPTESNSFQNFLILETFVIRS